MMDQSYGLKSADILYFEAYVKKKFNKYSKNESFYESANKMIYLQRLSN